LKRIILKIIQGRVSELNISVAELARCSDVDYQILHPFLQGKKGLNTETLERILWALDLTIIPAEQVK
jgi:predicted transcriptional regulator